MKYIAYIRIQSNFFFSNSITYFDNNKINKLLDNYINNVWNRTFRLDYYECKYLLYKHLTLPSLKRNKFNKIFYTMRDFSDNYDYLEKDDYIYEIDCDDIVCANFIEKIQPYIKNNNFPELLMWNNFSIDQCGIHKKLDTKLSNSDVNLYPGSNCTLFRKNNIYTNKVLFQSGIADYWNNSEQTLLIPKNFSLEIKNVTSLSRIVDLEKLKKELVCDGYSKTQLITMVEAQMRIINSLKSDFIFISEMQTLYEIYEQLI